MVLERWKTQMGLAHINNGWSGEDAAPRLKHSPDPPVTVESYLPSLSLSRSMSLLVKRRESHSVGNFR